MPTIGEISRQCKKCDTEITHKSHERLCNTCRKTNKCIDCNTAIWPTSKRCESCRQKGKLNCQYMSFGELNSNYKDGRTNRNYFCKDCGDIISIYYGLYKDGICQSCKGIFRDYSGKNNPNWKNGTNKLGARIRNLRLFKDWRLACLERDNFKCQNCNSEENLEVHHKVSLNEMIKKYNIIESKDAKVEPEFFMLENGITYCAYCHCLKDASRHFVLQKGEF